MTDLAGQLDIRLQRSGDGLRVAIGSTRPVTAARIFAGRPVVDVARLLPGLFSICATAQASACAAACERSLGVAPSAGARARRALLLRAETVKEHLWRLLLDWPKALDLAPGTTAMAEVMRAQLALRAALGAAGDPFLPGAALPAPSATETGEAAALHAAARQRVFAMAPADWLAETGTPAGLAAWAETAGTQAAALVRTLLDEDIAALGRNAVRPLPDAALPELAAALAGPDADAFVAEPAWKRLPRETTPFARKREAPLIAALAAEHGNGLLPRLTALLVELAEQLVALASTATAGPEPAAVVEPDAPPGTGTGSAPAARGLLVHRVVLDGERVASYRILAPTEWNFHPAGVVAAGLAGLGSAATERAARLYITAVDPCVGYRLSVS